MGLRKQIILLLGYSQAFAEGKCPRCNSSLRGWTRPKVDFLTANGTLLSPNNPLHVWRIFSDRSLTIRCHACQHSWPLFQGESSPSETPGNIDLMVSETNRLSEPFGTEERVVDNSKSSTSLTRTFTLSREWTKSLVIEAERALTTSSGATIVYESVRSVFTLGLPKHTGIGCQFLGHYQVVVATTLLTIVIASLIGAVVRPEKTDDGRNPTGGAA